MSSKIYLVVILLAFLLTSTSHAQLITFTEGSNGTVGGNPEENVQMDVPPDPAVILQGTTNISMKFVQFSTSSNHLLTSGASGQAEIQRDDGGLMSDVSFSLWSDALGSTPTETQEAMVHVEFDIDAAADGQVQFCVVDWSGVTQTSGLFDVSASGSNFFNIDGYDGTLASPNALFRSVEIKSFDLAGGVSNENIVELLQVRVTVPEPSAILTFGAALGLVISRRRRK